MNTRNQLKTKIFSVYLLIVNLFLSLSSCTKDPINLGGELTTVPEGYVRTILNLYVEPNQQVPTRASASEESAYDKNNVWVLVFDGTAPALTSKLMQAPVKATLSGTSPSQRLHALLRATGEACKIYVVTGLSSTMNTSLSGITAAQVETGSVTWSSLNAKLLTAAVTTTGIPIGGVNYIPMCTNAIDRTSGATKGTATLSEIEANFQRIVGKIDVTCIKEGVTPEEMLPLANFQLTGVTLWNGAKQGYVLPQATIATNLGGVQKYATVTSVVGNSIASKIYLYENNSPTTIIVKGKYNGATTESYYRLDLLNTTQSAPNRMPLSIERNTHYIVKISKVETMGYASEQEAYNNGPSNNIQFNIEVTDPSAHDLVSNGQYYLGLSNSEYIVFSGVGKTAVAVTEVTHNAPASVNEGTVTVTNVVGTAPTGISNPFTTRDGTKQSNKLNMTLPSGFVSCEVVLRLGNLMKTIRIERRADMLSFGGYIPVGDGYAHGSFSTPVSWAKLSNIAADDIAVGSNELNCTPEQPVYMILDGNIAIDKDAVDRSCEFYLSGGKSVGRSKIVIDQPKYNIISGEGIGVFKDNYVGTFHRHDQRGERVIRMSSTNNQFWMAQVVAGKDFIRLENGGSSDPKIFTSNFGDAENWPVNGEKIRITGMGAIEFRVGLTSTIPSNQVRYGLITVIHSGGVNRIFVRQGEKADYVMRPGDPIYFEADSLASETRPNAREVSPFNLTDPAGKTAALVNLSGNRGGWVQYPSQAGYLFQANTPYAWAPHERAVSFNTNATLVTGYDAVCPAGYRRIKDGPGSTLGLFFGSEMRQSLWYYPKEGQGKSDFENSMRGLLADGFFDRQTSTEATVMYGLTRKTSRVGSGVNVAYVGALIFNPYNYASIFLPAAGTLNHFMNLGSLANPGLDAIYWSSSYYDGTNGNYWYGSMEYLGSSFTFDNFFSLAIMGASVRCVVAP